MNANRNGLAAFGSVAIATVLAVVSIVKAEGWCTCINTPCDEVYLWCDQSCCCCRLSQTAPWVCDCHSHSYCKNPGGTKQCI